MSFWLVFETVTNLPKLLLRHEISVKVEILDLPIEIEKILSREPNFWPSSSKEDANKKDNFLLLLLRLRRELWRNTAKTLQSWRNFWKDEIWFGYSSPRLEAPFSEEYYESKREFWCLFHCSDANLLTTDADATCTLSLCWSWILAGLASLYNATVRRWWISCEWSPIRVVTQPSTSGKRIFWP